MRARTMFSTRGQPATVLEFVVGKASGGPAVSAVDIEECLFNYRRYKVGTPVARVTANDMRNLVAEYNETLGKSDPVIISFPKQELKGNKRTANYRPVFQ